MDNGGALIAPFIGWRKAGGQEEGGSGGGTSMAPVTGDGNGEGEAMGCNHFQR
jgi:hypothetical protein